MLTEVATNTDDTRVTTRFFRFVGTHFNHQKLLMEWVPKMLNSHKPESGERLPITLRLELGNEDTYEDGITLLKRLPGIDNIVFKICHTGLDEAM